MIAGTKILNGACWPIVHRRGSCRIVVAALDRIVTWLCIVALAAVALHANAKAVLCVSVDHTAVEAAHDDGGCAEAEEHATRSLGAPETACTDTPLAATANTAEARALAFDVALPRAIGSPETARSVSARSDSEPTAPPAIARAIASTVLLL